MTAMEASHKWVPEIGAREYRSFTALATEGAVDPVRAEVADGSSLAGTHG